MLKTMCGTPTYLAPGSSPTAHLSLSALTSPRPRNRGHPQERPQRRLRARRRCLVRRRDPLLVHDQPDAL